MDKIQDFLVKYPFIRILIISALFVLLAWVLVGCVPQDQGVIPDRVQHPFDVCLNNSEITRCKVSVEIER